MTRTRHGNGRSIRDRFVIDSFSTAIPYSDWSRHLAPRSHHNQYQGTLNSHLVMTWPRSNPHPEQHPFTHCTHGLPTKVASVSPKAIVPAGVCKGGGPGPEIHPEHQPRNPPRTPTTEAPKTTPNTYPTTARTILKARSKPKTTKRKKCQAPKPTRTPTKKKARTILKARSTKTTSAREARPRQQQNM